MPTPSSITLNGRPHRIDGAQTVTELLAALGLAGKPVVVELNGEAVLPGLHSTAIVAPGAKIEIVTLAAGG
jgi:thiamine biosynthesis protein ThiS